MTRPWERAIPPLVALTLASCAPLIDEVFLPLPLEPTAPFEVREGAGIIELPLRLARARDRDFSLAYQLVGLEAQDGCQNPDFGAADGRVEWRAGDLEATIQIWVADDDLAERDERFELRLEAAADAASNQQVVILDNDRTALLDARTFGVSPGAAGDQSAPLQAALDHAAELGRAVLLMAPGDYEISSVRLRPGTTLSAHGAHWRRPAFSAADVVSLRVEHAGEAPSAGSLVEGLSIDGRRDEQGPYREHERQDAHLVKLSGDPKAGGVLRVELAGVALTSGTGSGLLVGPGSDVTVCGLRASELWRDALTMNGGASQLKLRDFDATASQGTGLWLGVREAGFADSRRIDVEAEDIRVGAGDVEIEVSDDSRVSLQRLTMTAPPFRLDAPGGSVRIEDSVLMLGPSPQNQWGVLRDVEIVGSVFVASEPVERDGLPRSALSLTGQRLYPGAETEGAKRVALTDCRFELSPSEPSGSAVYALENLDPETSVVVTSSTLGAGFTDWFAADCSGCALMR
jgi:hypothetical protein